MAQHKGYLSNEDYQQLKALLDRHFDEGRVRVLVFGSRATGYHRADSDLDLVIISDHEISKSLKAFREALQYAELSVPVEAIAYMEATPQTDQRIQEEGILFWPQSSGMRISS